jgi:hypothetical protein
MGTDGAGAAQVAAHRIRSILSPRDDGVLDRDEIIYRAF